MPKDLVIVESPAKAKTINKYIGSDYTVKASVGHIRDLPKSELGVDEETFIPKYETLAGKEKVVKELRAAAKKAGTIYIASDPDREGEAIGWHVMNILGKDAEKVQRVRFHEITKSAVRKALEQPTGLDMNKVNAQQARRVLDRIVGYKLSPLLWDKVKRGLSAGRVQSVALKMIVDREREIEAFVPVEYWTVAATFDAEQPPRFTAKLAKIAGRKAEISNEEQARKIEKDLYAGTFAVGEIKKKEKKRKPLAPFTTSKMQQEAHRRFRFTVRRTMSLAQGLYEGKEIGAQGLVGLITYMRTDSTTVSGEALNQVREAIDQKYGSQYLPDKPNIYKNKKAAQEAHEAIRPTSVELTPEKVAKYLNKDELKLYTLIWQRFVASQMMPAIFDVTDVFIDNGDYRFKVSGEVLKFDGFLKATGEAERLREAEEDSEDEKKGPTALPPLEEGEKVDLVGNLDTRQNFTQPPPRYTEATLVKALEENGIGRPSTYASILQTIQSRDYTSKDAGKFVPSRLGMVVTDLLQGSFSELIDEQYTARLEDELDEIEEGKIEWQEALGRFSGKFSTDLSKAEKEMPVLKGGVPTDEKCEECGNTMAIKFGRYGEFLACMNYPECKNTKELDVPEEDQIEEKELDCDKCGEPMALKRSRHGQFYACTAYPECKNTKDPKLMDSGIEETAKEPCEKCGREMNLKSGRYGPFYGCSGYPECRNIRRLDGKKTAASEPTGVKCTVCGKGEFVKKMSRRGPFYACDQYPKCKTSMSYKPFDKACPDCGSPYLWEKELKREGHIEQCPDKECGYRAPFSGEPVEEAV